MDIATTVRQLTANPKLMDAAIRTAERFGIGREMFGRVLPHIGELAWAGADDPARIAQSVQAATGVDALSVLNLIRSITGAAQGLVRPDEVGVEETHGSSMAKNGLGPADRLPDQE